MRSLEVRPRNSVAFLILLWIPCPPETQVRCVPYCQFFSPCSFLIKIKSVSPVFEFNAFPWSFLGTILSCSPHLLKDLMPPRNSGAMRGHNEIFFTRSFWALCMCLMRFLELLPHNSVTFSNLVEGFYAPGEHRCDVCYCTVIGSQFCISCGVSDRFFCVSQRFWCQECVSVAFPSWVEFSAYWHCEEVSCIFLILQIIGRGCGVWWMCFWQISDIPYGTKHISMRLQMITNFIHI